MNVCQNNILRQIKKYAHMSKVLKSLRIFNFEDLYSYTKLSFLNSIKQNKITESIFQYLCNSSRKKNSKSFIQDIWMLEKRFNSSITDIYHNSKEFKTKIKRTLDERDGIIDSITYCFKNFKSSNFRLILENIIKTDFKSNIT